MDLKNKNKFFKFRISEKKSSPKYYKSHIFLVVTNHDAKKENKNKQEVTEEQKT